VAAPNVVNVVVVPYTMPAKFGDMLASNCPGWVTYTSNVAS
jgi:hypothetical protein